MFSSQKIELIFPHPFKCSDFRFPHCFLTEISDNSDRGRQMESHKFSPLSRSLRHCRAMPGQARMAISTPGSPIRKCELVFWALSMCWKEKALRAFKKCRQDSSSRREANNLTPCSKALLRKAAAAWLCQMWLRNVCLAICKKALRS